MNDFFIYWRQESRGASGSKVASKMQERNLVELAETSIPINTKSESNVGGFPFIPKLGNLAKELAFRWQVYGFWNSKKYDRIVEYQGRWKPDGRS